jgi:integrase
LNRYKNSLPEVDKSDKVITKWKPQSLTGRFSNLLAEYGLPHTRLHDLRHYNATIMMSVGIPDKQAAARLGHSSVQTLRKTYQHILKGMDEDAAQKINETFTHKIEASDKETKKKNFKVVSGRRLTII